MKAFTSISTATLPQLAIARFLERGGYERHLRALRHFNARQVSGLIDVISRCFPPGTRVSQPAGGFVVWVELPDDVDAVRL